MKISFILCIRLSQAAVCGVKRACRGSKKCRRPFRTANMYALCALQHPPGVPMQKKKEGKTARNGRQLCEKTANEQEKVMSILEREKLSQVEGNLTSQV